MLTGRENIYINGAVLGMTKKEIDAKFDEIVEFAGLEEFIDTPVKFYSSGMYVRLGFAVAAHLEPQVLLIDEVLAVGDAAFQKKCLGKMDEVAKGGRTVLFVSHNMVAVRNLCHDAIWLREGCLVDRGPALEITRRYLQEIPSAFTQADIARLIRELPPDPTFRLQSIAVRQDDHVVGESVVNGKPLDIEVCYEVLEKVWGLRIYFDLCDEYGDILVRSFHDEDVGRIRPMLPGQYRSTVTIPANFLAPRQYRLVVRATIHNVRTCTPGGITIPLSVKQTGLSNKAYASDTSRAKLAPILKWRTDSCQGACS